MTLHQDTVISASGLGKRFTLGHNLVRTGRETLRDMLVNSLAGLKRSTIDLLHGRALVAGDVCEEFWALKGINFDIRRGEVIGVIGRNGAGKSTLLKVLSRITEPSEGRVEIKGRLASLLEVGTGFHPELSGRENIYLNGTILGMRRKEISEKFDEIVEFAGVERFLDTPVKRYSSGMYVRLAFAVAAHLEPEILVIDEVLAVGDAEFQKKCLGKMQDVARHGRTILFVSHNMGAVRSLCGRCMVLEQGQLVGFSETGSAIATYLDSSGSENCFYNNDSQRGDFAIETLTVSSDEGLVRVRVSVFARQDSRLDMAFIFRDANGSPVGMATCGGLGSQRFVVTAGVSEHAFDIDTTMMASGRYSLSLEAHVPGGYKVMERADIARFEHIQSNISGYGEVLDQRYGHGSVQFAIIRR